ncbi:hypothetical protein H072_8454 [Dactylellina haptotyla CBS 200.50]|uniref:ERCC4 domain-containing protein n=1 Tax=Dactylellina haptotyla (strain CBS 200.50) TaxID=1284197 RepID=S8A536_DACHA|nr:hypothetical protein H072_8454 [Dactylellina haptotyla CBS 200.50]
MAANGRAKVAAPVISLLSSDDSDIPDPAPPKRTSTSTSLKENERPGTSSRDPKPTKACKPKNPTPKKSSKDAPKRSSTSEKSRVSKPTTSTSKTVSKSTKHVEAITLISSSPPPQARQTDYTTTAYSKIFGALSSDPILSQSSPPAPRITQEASTSPKPANKRNSLFSSILNDDFSDLDFSSPNHRVEGRRAASPKAKGKARATSPPYSGLSKETQELLRKLESKTIENEPTIKRRRVDKVDLDISESESDREPSDLDIPPPSSALAPGRKSKLTEAEKEARKLEREILKSQKAAEKEALKEQKKAEREAKALQRNENQALSTANKLKGSHVQTVGEMIVNLSSDFYATKAGVQLRSFLDVVKVNSHAPFDSPIPNIIKWRRVVTSRWDEDNDLFVPIPREIRDESHILTVTDAKQFVNLANSPSELDSFITSITSGYPGCKPILVIEGLAKLINKSKSNQSRAYAAQVRNRMREDGGGEERVRVDKAAQAVDEDNVEDALLKLQLIHGWFICQTTDYMGTAEAISSYTQHISQIPYKHAKATLNNSTNFCMDVGQVASGKTVEDTYNKMLQCVHMSTAGVAAAIQSEYPSVQKLFRAFMDGGDDVLKDLRVARTGNGRALGPAMSRKIARVLTGRDEWELES